MIDPEQIEADEATAASLRQMAALLGEFYDACRARGLPDSLAAAVVRDWHTAVISDGVVTWEEETDE